MTEIKSLWNRLLQRFRLGNASMQMLYINVALFVLFRLLQVLLTLFNSSWSGAITNWFALPSDVSALITHGWTPITYMFFHWDLLHLLFNMICLYSFGKILLLSISNKQLVGLYLFGGLVAAALYLLAYNLLSYYAVRSALLLGASGSIMAIIVASAMLMPYMRVSVLLIGAVQLKWIALATVGISVLGITGSNSGGELAHLGGALAGYLFVVLLRKNRDVSQPFTKVIDLVAGLLKPRKKPKKPHFHYAKPKSDGEYNQQKAHRTEEVDAILDKIKRSGYESLTAEEKRRLFER